MYKTAFLSFLFTFLKIFNGSSKPGLSQRHHKTSSLFSALVWRKKFKDHEVWFDFFVQRWTVVSRRNLRKSDQGIYSVQVRYKNLPSESKTISLKFNPRFELEKIVTGLCSALVVMLVILLFVFFLWYNWIQVQLFVRRHNGKYDKGEIWFRSKFFACCLLRCIIHPV